jgi:hypothetical protein
MKKITVLFMVIFTQSVFANANEMITNIVEQYKMLGGHKALVVAIDGDKYAAGWGFKFSNTKRAIAKAMKGCNKSRLNYQVTSVCEVYMIDNKLQVTTTSRDNAVALTDDNTVINTVEDVVVSTNSTKDSVDSSIVSQINEVEETIEEVTLAD